MTKLEEIREALKRDGKVCHLYGNNIKEKINVPLWNGALEIVFSKDGSLQDISYVENPNGR